MVITFCDVTTVARCRQVNSVFKALIDTEPAVQRATFGRLPQSVVVKIIEEVRLDTMDAESGSRDVVWSRGYGAVAVFRRLNKTYHKLVRNQPRLKPLLFRGGLVFSSMKELRQHRPRMAEFNFHPLVSALSLTLDTDPADLQL